MSPANISGSEVNVVIWKNFWLYWLAGIMGSTVMILVTPLPTGAAFEAGGLQPIITVGRVPGNGDNQAVDIGELRLGLGHYFRDRLGFYGELSLYRPTGRREGRPVDTIGLGLAAFSSSPIRPMPWPCAAVSASS